MLPIFQVDAFTSELFGGNPAAVVPLSSWIDDTILQSIALENNLAETAFLVSVEGGYELRWFTPASEVALCGHATLASAHVLINHLGYGEDSISFFTRQSGTLTVARQEDGRLAMSFPSIPVTQSSETDLVSHALGATPVSLHTGNYAADEFDFLAVFATQEEVSQLAPGMSAFKPLTSRGVIATAAGHDCDFVSRYFAPNFGIEEDPVTGSAHCLLAPYWAGVTAKSRLLAKQISRRGGVMDCEIQGDRTFLIGSCADYMRGEIYLPAM